MPKRLSTWSHQRRTLTKKVLPPEVEKYPYKLISGSIPLDSASSLAPHQNDINARS